jgi:hypothetical protein
MLTLKHTITGCNYNSFDVNQSSFLYHSIDKKEIIITSLYFEDIAKIPYQYLYAHSFNLLNDKLMLNGTNYCLHVMTYDGKDMEMPDIMIDTVFKEYELFSCKLKKTNRGQMREINSFNPLWDSIYTKFERHGNYFFGFRWLPNEIRPLFGIINIDTGKPYWEQDVSELGLFEELGTKEQKSGYIHKIIGVHEGIVWVSITNDTILGLSIATGEVLHLIRQTLPFDFEFLNESRIPNSAAVLLNKTQNILQGFSQGFYWETDLATMQTQVWNLRAYFQSIPLDDFSFRIEAFGSNHLVFTCGLEYDAIGLFNTQARQVDWWQHLGENGPRRGVNVMTLKVVGDRIYTIDTTNTLRIFERSNQ